MCRPLVFYCPNHFFFSVALLDTKSPNKSADQLQFINVFNLKTTKPDQPYLLCFGFTSNVLNLIKKKKKESVTKIIIIKSFNGSQNSDKTLNLMSAINHILIENDSAVKYSICSRTL